jgi:hypothetical protein
MMGACPKREAARLWTLLRISVRMAAQSLGSSKTHSSDSRYISPVPEASIESETVLEGAGTFRASAFPIFRSMVPTGFSALIRSLMLLGPGELVRFARGTGAGDGMLSPAGLDV